MQLMKAIPHFIEILKPAAQIMRLEAAGRPGHSKCPQSHLYMPTSFLICSSTARVPCQEDDASNTNGIPLTSPWKTAPSTQKPELLCYDIFS